MRRAVERKLGEVSEVSTKVAGEAGEGGEALSADLKSKDEERAGMGTCTSKEAVAVMDEGEVKAEEHAGGNGGSASWVVVNPVQSGRLGGAGKPADSKGIHGSVQAARVGESGSLVLAQGPAMYNAIQTWSMLDSKAFAHALVPNPMLELPEARFELPIVIPSHGLPASVLSRLGIEVREETGIRVSRSVEDMHEEAGIRVGNSAEGMHEPILGDDELVLEMGEIINSGDGSDQKIPLSSSSMVGQLRVLVPMKGLIDPTAELARLDKAHEKLQKQADGIARKLGNEGFVSKAPAEVVDAEKAKLAELEGQLTAMTAQMEQLKAS
mgnify:CR=1 FL=1